MSFKDSDEPKAFLIWNRHHLAPTTIAGREPAPLVEGLTRFNFVINETDGPECSPLQAGNITPISELTESDELEELERSDSAVKDPVYNIIQNKLNLCEKRGPKFACRECRYVVPTRLSMVTHMKMHQRPFCEVCFHSFDSKKAVHNHIESKHPEVVVRERTPTPLSRDFYCLQTVAPPNTPNPMSDDEMFAIEELLSPVSKKVPVTVAVVQKLLSTEETDGGVSTEDEQRLVIDDRAVPGSSRGRPKTKNALKRPLKKKKVNKTKLKDTPDTVMKKITSRFGRCISLKMPQF